MTFAQADGGFTITTGERTVFVDFAAAPFPYLDAAAVLFTDDARPLAEDFIERSGLVLRRRRLAERPTAADHDWLNDLALEVFGDMLGELNASQAELAVLREKTDDLRTDFSLLQTYLYRDDVPPLRKIWHAPFEHGTELDVTSPFHAVLPCSSWGLTRLQVWIAKAPEDPASDLSVALRAADTHEIIARWSTSSADTDQRKGWMSYNLETSISTYARTLEIIVSGKGWQLGASAPWLMPDGSDGAVTAFAGPALRVYATIPGMAGPRGISVPVDDRRRYHVLVSEIANARPLSVPPDLGFTPVSCTKQGLLVHPVAGSPMIAVIDDACSPWTVIVRLSVCHDHTEGEPFLITVTPASDPSDCVDGRFPRAEEVGAISELGPVPAGSWVRLDAGASARIEFTFPPVPRRCALYVATRPAEGQRTDLAWATVTGVEVVLADG